MTHKAIFLIDDSGNMSRVRTMSTGQDGALDLLKVACPNRTQLVIERDHPDYMTLKQTFVLVGNFNCIHPTEILHKFISRVDGWVTDHVWLVKRGAMDPMGALSLGAFRRRDAALEVAEAFDKTHVNKSRMELVKLS